MKFLLVFVLVISVFSNSISQVKHPPHYGYIEKAFQIDKIKSHFHICDIQETLSVIDTAKFFDTCSFSMCGRVIKILNISAFPIKIDYSAKGMENTIAVWPTVKDKKLILHFYQPVTNADLILEIINYKSTKPTYKITQIGWF